jgi:hypothetical protein
MFGVTRVVLEKNGVKKTTWVNSRYAYYGHKITLLEKREVFFGLRNDKTVNRDWVVVEVPGPSIQVEEILERKDY